MIRRMRTSLVVMILLLGPAVGAAAEGGAKQYADAVGKTAGLVAWWRFEGALTDEKSVAPGTPVGGAAKFVAGPGGGKAVACDGGRLVTMGPAPKLDLAETTVEMWFKLTADAKRGPNPCLIAKRTAGQHQQTRFSIHVWNDYSGLAVWNGKAVSRFTPAMGGIRKGQWYYLVVTSKPGRMRMYLDGVACTPPDGPASFNVAMTELPLQIASSAPTPQEPLDCVIDEVAIYSRELSGDEIAAHADAMGWKDKRERIARKLAEIKAEQQKRIAQRMARLTDEKLLFARGEQAVYSGEQLGAIRLPVGGIGSGLIQLDGTARLAIWQIFNNHVHQTVPHSFFAVRTQAGKGKPVVRALQTEPAGPFAAMKELTFRGEYPYGWYTFDEPAPGVRVTLEAFNPLVPGDAKSSGIPCAIFNLTAENRGRENVKVSFLAAQQNAAGYSGKTGIQGRACKDYGGNTNRVQWEGNATIMHMAATKQAKEQPKKTAGPPAPDPARGEMVLMALSAQATSTAAWESLDKLAADFAEDGKVDGPRASGPSQAGQTVDAALTVPVTLEPGEKKTVTFVLTWYFPTVRHGHGKWGGAGNRYQTWWPGALDVARHVRDNLPKLTEQTRLYHDTLYASNLPHWLVDRIASQVAVLRSKTCFWTADGYFGGWEGCCPNSGCCYGNCSHVWHYAQAHAWLFPQIGRLMRQQELRFQNPDGSIPFRQPQHGPATDGQCGTVLGAYREHLLSTDSKWLADNWLRIKKAMDFIIAAWDSDEDGVMAGKQWNTLDCAIDGSSSWLGSLYLAALAAAEKMAAVQGHAGPAARYRAIRESGMKKQDQTLFNGEYYFQLPGKTRIRDYLSGCHIDQVLGQWWAHLLDLGWLYPRDRVRTALQSLVKYNFRPDFVGIRQVPRKFVADEDAGMQMITWPKGGRPPAGKTMLYGDEVMTGFEYSAAVAMIQAGLIKEGFMVVRAIHDRYDGRQRTGLTPSATASWGYSGNPFGDDECGKFYARAMSVWSVLLACQGCVCDGPAGLIGFRPIWRPDDHKSMFTAAEGWGLFTQQRSAGKQTARLELRYGQLTVKTLLLAVPEKAQLRNASVLLSGKPVTVKFTVTGSDVRIRPTEAITLEAGQAVDVVLTY